MLTDNSKVSRLLTTLGEKWKWPILADNLDLLSSRMALQVCAQWAEGVCVYLSSPPSRSLWWVELGPQVRPFFLLAARSSFLQTALRPQVLLPSLGVTVQQKSVLVYTHAHAHTLSVRSRIDTTHYYLWSSISAIDSMFLCPVPWASVLQS